MKLTCQNTLIILSIMFIACSDQVFASEFTLIYCTKDDGTHMAPSLSTEECKEGYVDSTRDKWIEYSVETGRLSPIEQDFFDSDTPDTFGQDRALIGFGTAFFINSDGDFITNYHVVSNCNTVAMISKVDLFSADIVAASPDHDVAVLRSRYRPPDWVTFRSSALELGEDAYVFGYPYLTTIRTLNLSNGVVSGIAPLGNPEWVQISNAIQPGNSGGPILDESGLVSGVAVARLDIGENIGFGIQVPVVLEMLKKHSVIHAVSESPKSVSLPSMAQDASRYTRPILCLK